MATIFRCMLVLIFTAVLIGGSAHAEVEPPPQGAGVLEVLSFLSDLELTGAQKKQIAAILAKDSAERQRLVDEVVEKHRRLMDLIHEGTSSEGEVRAAAGELAAAAEELAVVRARIAQGIRQTLTEKQQALAAAWKADRRRDVDARIGRLRGLLSRWVERHS